MNETSIEDILDYRCWNPMWDAFLSVTDIYDPLEIQEIVCIVSMPDRSGVLIISDSGFYTTNETALNALKQFSFAHCLPEYPVLSSVLKDIGAFGRYKFPWACPNFTLCPLEGVRQSIWINPLKIENIYELGGLHYAQLLNGIKLMVPVQRYYALLRSEIACGVLAAIRQDTSDLSSRPMDYLKIPNTSFGRSLVKRPLLKKFVTCKYEIHRRYQRARFLHYFEKLEKNQQDLHWENWQ
ncbi:hypothetical protein G15_0242 [Enterococcus avium]|nr:hypothetical protein G15_0242 [Enterococcus avium]